MVNSRFFSAPACALALAAVVACGGDWQTGSSGPDVDAGSSAPEVDADVPLEELVYPRGLHVVGNHIVDDAGTPMFLRGVNRSGSEYSCIKGAGAFDGPSNESSVRALASWKINAVRVPLNESCWLGTNNATAASSLAVYKSAIVAYVALLHKYKLVPILDLHWAAPEGSAADRLRPMPNADHSETFWADVATTFMADTGVVFELYNEPYPDCNRDTDAAWQCWRDGCEARLSGCGAATPETYRATGMQALVTAVRTTGATHLILAGGVQYSNGLTQWAAYKPEDTLNNLAPAWHIYNNNPCKTLECYNKTPAALAADFPVVATEFGQNDCAGDFVTPLMQFLDQFGSGYLAWSWNVLGPCIPAGPGGAMGQPWPLISNYDLATPNSGFAQAVHDHFSAMVP